MVVVAGCNCRGHRRCSGRCVLDQVQETVDLLLIVYEKGNLIRSARKSG
jgi:hypothetical protein